MNLEELKIAKTYAEKLAYTAQEEFDSLRDGKISQATREIDEELASQREKVNLLYQDSIQAARAVEDELVELAKEEGHQGKYALGSKLQKVHRKWSGYGYRSNPETLFGILEVVTRETQFPGNTPSWNRPSNGSLIVRICTKDGKPGKKFVKWTRYESSQWKPVEEI